VGVALGVLLVIGLATAFFLRRKKRQGTEVPSQDQQYMGDASYATNGQTPYELSAYKQVPHELSTGQAPYENVELPPESQFKSKPIELDAR
jgi:hypothetical protein